MTGPITPHIEATHHRDGVHIRLKDAEIVLPADMAYDLGRLLLELAKTHDPLGSTPLPQAQVKGDKL